MEIVEEGEDNLKVAKVVVAENQLSLAIGKKGQNSRHAARLCGVKIDIHTGSDKMAGSEEDEFKEKSAFQDSLDETENTEKTSDSQNDIEVEESAFAGLSEDNE